MDVVCAALELDTRSHEPSPAGTSPHGGAKALLSHQMESDANQLAFQLCCRVSLALTQAMNTPASSAATCGDMSNGKVHTLSDHRGRMACALMDKGGARCLPVRSLLWTDVAALPPFPGTSSGPMPPLSVLADPPLTPCAAAHDSVVHWVLSALWEAQYAHQKPRLTTSPTILPATDGAAETAAAVVQAYAQRCALLRLAPSCRSDLVSSESVCSVTALPPMVWLAAFLSSLDARTALLRFLLSPPTHTDENAQRLVHPVTWRDCQQLLERPLLRATPSAYLEWFALSVPSGFEARIHAHVYFLLAAFYVDAPFATEGEPTAANGHDGGGENGADAKSAETTVRGEVMDALRFRSLAQALVSQPFTRTPFVAARSLAEVAARASRRSGRSACSPGPASCRTGVALEDAGPARAGDDGDDDNDDDDDSAGQTAGMGHEVLASIAASAFFAHALDCVGTHTQASDDARMMAEGRAARAPALSSPRSSTSVAVMAATHMLRCVEAYGPCYGVPDTCVGSVPDTITAPCTASSLSARDHTMRETHRAVSAALLLLATAGESATALYLRSRLEPLHDVWSATLEAINGEGASSPRALIRRILIDCAPSSPSSWTPPWGVASPSTLSNPPLAAEALTTFTEPSEAIFSFLSYDPAPLLIPSSLSEIRDPEDDAYAHMLTCLTPAPPPTQAPSLGAVPVRSPFRSMTTVVAVLLRHPWVQLRALDQVWSLCTAITAVSAGAPSSSLASSSHVAPLEVLHHALNERLHTLYDVYAHSIIDAGVGGTGVWPPCASRVEKKKENTPPRPEADAPVPHLAPAAPCKKEPGEEDVECQKYANENADDHADAERKEVIAQTSDAHGEASDRTSAGAPRRRLKLFSTRAPPPLSSPHGPAGEAASTPTRTPMRQTLPLTKRPRDEDVQTRGTEKVSEEVRGGMGTPSADRHCPHSASNKPEGVGEMVVPFDAPVLGWRTSHTSSHASARSSSSAPLTASTAAADASAETFSIGTVLADTLLSLTRVVQDPLLEVLDCAERAATPSRLRPSLAVPVCAARLKRLASSQLVRVEGTASPETVPLGSGMTETIGVVTGLLVNYFVYRWTSLLAQAASRSPSDLGEEGVRRLPRLFGPLLSEWPHDARQHLFYVPISAHVLPRLLASHCTQSNSVTADDGSAMSSAWDAWRCFLVDKNLMLSSA